MSESGRCAKYWSSLDLSVDVCSEEESLGPISILGIDGPATASPLTKASSASTETWCLGVLPENVFAEEVEPIAALEVLYGVGEGVRRRQDIESSFK